MVPVPRTVEPSRKATTPVAPACTAAAKVTGCAGADGFTEDVNVMTEATFATVTCVGGDTTGTLVEAIRADAVIGFEPSGREGTVKVAAPLTTGAVPRRVVPS
jgi:hypothetical protein